MPYRTTGLRLTRSYDSARNVVISSRRPSRWAPMVPNSRPVSQIASAQPLTTRSVCVRVRVGAEVEIVAESAEQGVPHRTADQVQLVAGAGEAAAQLVGDRGDPEQFGDGVALRGGEFAAVGGVRSGGFGHGIASLSGQGAIRSAGRG